jgi:hypothetical protein
MHAVSLGHRISTFHGGPGQARHGGNDTAAGRLFFKPN